MRPSGSVMETSPLSTGRRFNSARTMRGVETGNSACDFAVESRATEALSRAGFDFGQRPRLAFASGSAHRQHRYLQMKFFTVLTGFSKVTYPQFPPASATSGCFFFGDLSAITIAQKVLYRV